MKLKTFTIKKLFNKYDVRIKLDEKCVILLGANGVGKTTALRILHCFLSSNYVDIVAAPFESVIVDVDREELLEFEYEYFLPTKENLIKRYVEHLRRKDYDMTYSEGHDYYYPGQPKSLEKNAEEFETALKEIEKANKYGELVYSLYIGKELSNIVKRILKKYVNYDELIKAKLVEADTYITEFFMGSPLLNDSQGQPFLPTLTTFMFDSVENYKISNELIYDSAITDADLEWLNSNPSAAYGHKGLMREVFLKTYKEDKSFKDYYISQTFHGGNKNIVDVNRHVFNKLTKDGLFELNRLINIEYFDFEFVQSINNKAKKYAEELFNKYSVFRLEGDKWKVLGYKNSEDLTEDERRTISEVKNYYTEDVIRDYYEYIKPILVRHSFFDMDLVAGDTYSDYEFVDVELGVDIISEYRKRLLIDYMKEVLPLVKDVKNRSERVTKYEEVIKKYLVDKYIVIKPCGIQIKEGSAVSRTNTRLFVLYDTDDIDLSVISSGERKILTIFAVAIFGEATLFLDEPELSLSLVWQETLLPDILKYGNTQGLYLATHSPYISRDEELEKYLTFLPQREK